MYIRLMDEEKNSELLSNNEAELNENNLEFPDV